MKKRALKFLIGTLTTLAVLGGAGVSYLKIAYPKFSPPADLRIEATPRRLERGKYLARHVAACIDCHSDRDFNRYSAPVVTGTEGKGGAPYFDQKFGLPGHLYPPNITPAGLSTWSDGEILRAMTEGVSRDGRPLFPLMPYPGFAALSQEDAYSIIAYIRTLAPIPSVVPATQLDFPVNLIVRTLPRPTTLAKTAPNPADRPAYGAYLVKIAGCADCHTPMDKGAPVAGMEFAGGSAYTFPNGTITRSANLTPDPETGLGKWTREAFVKRFRNPPMNPVGPSDFNTVMSWELFSGMTDEDLGSIYDYLRTLKPVKNAVVRFSAPGQKLTQE